MPKATQKKHNEAVDKYNRAVEKSAFINSEARSYGLPKVKHTKVGK